MRYFLLLLTFISASANADTINNYINISNNIPQMEMKADPQSQAWARSARNVITITCESIAETMLQANETAKSHGRPIFCLPPEVHLSSVMLDGLIRDTYKELSSQQSDKDKMTVSQIAWLGITKKFPCEQQNTPYANQMAHMRAIFEK